MAAGAAAAAAPLPTPAAAAAPADRHDRHHHYPGGLLESGLPGLELRGAITDPSGPLCANLSLPVRAALRLVPAPSADKLCPNLLTGPLHPCTLGALIEHFLQRTAGAARCNKAGQVAPPGAPDRLPDRRPLPPGAFADPGAVFSAEGATHHWLYRVILNLEAYLGEPLRPGGCRHLLPHARARRTPLPCRPAPVPRQAASWWRARRGRRPRGGIWSRWPPCRMRRWASCPLPRSCTTRCGASSWSPSAAP